MDNKKKKRKIKKNKNKQKANQAVIATDAVDVEKSSNQPWKLKFPCMLCKADHLLRYFPNLPKVLEVWSISSHQPFSSTFGDHAGYKPSTSDNKTHGKGKVKFPCRLCEGNHPIHICPYMDEASKVLDNLTSLKTCLLTGYQNLSLNPPLVDQMIDQNSYLVNPTLSKVEFHESIPGKLLVEKIVDLILLSFDHIHHVESIFIPLRFFCFLQIPKN